MTPWRSKKNMTPAQVEVMLARLGRTHLAVWGPWDGKCTRCSGDGPFRERRRVCKACLGKDSRAYYDAHPEQRRAQMKRYRQHKARDPDYRRKEAERVANYRAKTKYQ